MKHLKLIGLAAVAAMALSGLAGVGTASATELCSTNSSPCTGTVYSSGTVVEAKLKTGKTAVLTNNITDVTCTASTVTGKTTSTGGAGVPVSGTITGLTFTSCKDTFGDTCTVTVLNLPYNAEISGGGGNGTLTAKSSGKGNPGATVVCGSLINCTFSTALASLSVTGGNPATALANKISLSRMGGFCPKESFWDAEYEVTTPKPLFIV